MKKIISILAILVLVIGLTFIVLNVKAQDNKPNESDDQEQEEEMERPTEEGPQIPEDIKGVVPDQDFIDSFCYALKWRSIEMYSTFDIAQKVFAQAQQKAAEIGISLSLPDIAALRSGADQKINAVCTATTIDGALAAMKNFMDFAQNKVRQSFESIRQEIEGPMKAKGEELGQKMRSQMNIMQPPPAAINIKQLLEDEQAKLQQEMTQMIGEGKLSPDEAKDWMSEKMKSATEELMKQATVTATSTAPEITKEALEKSPEFKKFMEVGDFFKNMGKEFMRARKMKNPQAEEFKRLALEKRKELTFKIIDKKIGEAIEELENSKDDIDEARKANPQIPSADDIINELKKDVEDLKAKLSEAIEKGDETRFEKLMNDFRDKWENKRKEMQQKQSAKSVCTLAIEKVKDARSQIENAIEQLTKARGSCEKREDIEQCHKFNLHLDLVDNLKQKLSQILSSINDAENICKTADENTPPGQIIKLLNNIRKEGSEAENLKEKFNNLIK